jgi:hypothetical protein
MIIQGVTLKNVTVQDPSVPVLSSMLLYLDAGNTASYPGTGSTWYDISGNTNNTTGSTGVTYSSASGGYFDLNGVGYFTTATAKYNKTYTGKTVFVAAKAGNAFAGVFRCLFGSFGANRNFNLYLYNTGSAYQMHYSAGGGGGFSSNLNYTPGNWATFAVTQTTGGLVSYYYNGQPAGTNNIAFSQYLSSTSENVGASDNYWYGPIGMVGIYGSTLTTQQIKAMHNSLAPRYGLVTA